MFKTIYDQNLTTAEASKDYLGGKGYGLWWMQQQGINVPPALIFPTTLCIEYRKAPKTVMKQIAKCLDEAFDVFLDKMGYMPLLSVRSGAKDSMPGMMDTILNVGITPVTSVFWSNKLGEECITNCALRLSEMYGSTVLGLTPRELQAAQDSGGVAVPFTLKEQVLGCIEAVFKSWDNERAKFYRKMNNISDDGGTAVTLQAMVFGNLNDNSGTGVLFTRNPDTGENVVVGEFLPKAQGEDVVAGTVTPLPLSKLALWNPVVSKELLETVTKLEDLKKNVQDVEFTIQDGKLYILQTRDAKRSAKAAIRIAMEMHADGTIDQQEVFNRVSRKEFDIAQLAILDPKFKGPPAFTGLPACGGVVTGVVVKSSAAAINCKTKCILVTQETTPDDIEGMHAAGAVLTMTGGATSHAAVVARSMNKPCVVGLSVTLAEFTDGEIISIDGSTGRVWKGTVPVIDGSADPALTALRALLWVTSGARGLDTKEAPDLISMESSFSLPLEAQLERIKKALDTTTSVLYVDCRASTDEDSTAFFGAFHEGSKSYTSEERSLINAIECNEELAQNPKLIVVTSTDTSLKRVTGITTLEQLVVAQGDVILSLESGLAKPVVDKLMQLKGPEISPMVVGELKKGVTSFVTEAQVVVSMLK